MIPCQGVPNYPGCQNKADSVYEMKNKKKNLCARCVNAIKAQEKARESLEKKKKNICKNCK
ncbi:MAG: hypothetical protein DRH26_01360 [Deltaproteobacteria bacterium]|nr:MAG: hypothetical protein DRH26_01360 [Deltaproteobacteria bacterium]